MSIFEESLSLLEDKRTLFSWVFFFFLFKTGEPNIQHRPVKSVLGKMSLGDQPELHRGIPCLKEQTNKETIPDHLCKVTGDNCVPSVNRSRLAGEI